jgi:hypothetical protein
VYTSFFICYAIFLTRRKRAPLLRNAIPRIFSEKLRLIAHGLLPWDKSFYGERSVSRSAHKQNEGPKPVRDDQFDIASRLFWAICARYPDRIITLFDESGRVVARNGHVGAPERQFWNE